MVTSVGPDGQPVGTTANAVSSLSLDPPLILVCFDRSSATLAAVLAHQAFAVNVLGARQQHLSANFARRGLAAAWDGVRHRRGPTGSPRLDGVIASLECTLEHRLDGGDHEIVVGRVREVETSGDGATRCCSSAAATPRSTPDHDRGGSRPYMTPNPPRSWTSRRELPCRAGGTAPARGARRGGNPGQVEP